MGLGKTRQAVIALRVAGGVVTCACPGFSYRGNCTHAETSPPAGAGRATPTGRPPESGR
jgi:hypothetical protein